MRDLAGSRGVVELANAHAIALRESSHLPGQSKVVHRPENLYELNKFNYRHRLVSVPCKKLYLPPSFFLPETCFGASSERMRERRTERRTEQPEEM